MRRGILPGLVALAAASALTLSGCGSSGGGSSTGGGGGGGSSDTIGFIGAQTGENAQLGLNISNGAQLAVAQHNAKSGAKQVKLKIYDTKGDATQATSQAQLAIKDKLVGVVGPAFSSESKNSVPILEQAQLPNISASATAVSLAAKGWKTWHRVLANDDVQGPGVADFMSTTLKVKKAAVIDDQTEYGKGLGDAVRKQLAKDGVTVAVNDSINPDSSDFSATINKVKPQSPDAVFFAGYYSAAGKLVKQMRDAGLKSRFVSGDGSADQKIVDNGGPAANGALLSCTCQSAAPTAAGKKFAADYKAKYGTDPATYSSEGYDAAAIFLKAIDEGKTSSADVLSFLSSLTYEGVSKTIKFAPNGELAGSNLFISEVQNGKVTPLGDTKSAKPTAG